MEFNSAEKKPRTNRRKRATVFLLLLVVVAGAWYAAFLRRTRVALQQRDALLEELRRRGEPASLQDLNALTPPPPTAASCILKAMLLTGGRTSGYLQSSSVAFANAKFVCGEEPQVGSLPGALPNDIHVREPGVHPDLVPILQAAQPILRLMEKAVELPPGRLMARFDEAHPITTNIASWADLNTVFNLMLADWLDAVGRGDRRRAFKAFLLMCRFPYTLVDEPGLFGYAFIRSGCTEAVGMIGPTLSMQPLDDREFEVLDDLLLKWRRLSPRGALRGELAFLVTALNPPSLDDLYLALADVPRGGGWSPEVVVRNLHARYLSSWLGAPDRAEEQKVMLQAYIGRLPWLDAVEQGEPLGDLESKLVDPPSRLVEISAWGSSLRSSVDWHHCIRAASLIARLALRLDCQRRRNGSAPEKLGDVFEPSVASLPMADDDIEYHRTEAGFLLQSKGQKDGSGRKPLRVEVRHATPPKR